MSTNRNHEAEMLDTQPDLGVQAEFTVCARIFRDGRIEFCTVSEFPTEFAVIEDDRIAPLGTLPVSALRGDFLPHVLQAVEYLNGSVNSK